MSQVFDYAQNFLDHGGYDLGFSENELPELPDMNNILQHNVKVWEYKGKSHREYYGG